MAMKKIIFIVTSLGEGGAQKVMSMIANECVVSGYMVNVISIMKTDVCVSLDRAISLDNLGIEKVGGKSNFFVLLKQPLLYKKIKKANPDIIVLFGTLPAIFCFRVSKAVTKHIIACERDNPLGMKRYMFKLARQVYSSAQMAVFQMPQVANIYGIKKDRYTVIPNACLTYESHRGRFDLDSCLNSKLVISAGRLEKVKRFDVLIDAFRLIHQEFTDFKLDIFGDGSERSILQERIDSNGLHDVITLKGHVDNIWKNTEAPFAFVLSSESEGIPNVIMEAMYYGIPCVATDCDPGGAKFLLENEKFGLIAKKNNPDDLAEKIKTLITRPDQYKYFVEKGRYRINEFNKETILRMWISAFDEALEVKKCC